MTYDEWENGKRLTVNNATKEQLKFLVRDEKRKSDRLYEEKQEQAKLIDALTKCIGAAIPLLKRAGLYDEFVAATKA